MHSPSLVAAMVGVFVAGMAGDLGSVDAQSKRSIWDGVYTQEQAQKGGPLYETGCASCHGGGLEGGETAPALVGGEFMWAWNGLSVGDLFERLRVSMPEGNPSEMSTAQKADVLAFVLSRNDVPVGAEELANQTSRLRTISFDAIPPQ